MVAGVEGAVNETNGFDSGCAISLAGLWFMTAWGYRVFFSCWLPNRNLTVVIIDYLVIILSVHLK
jgi:hypothetical protein